MSAQPPTVEKNGVILIREGIGRHEYPLSEGATLADLLKAAGVGTEGQVIHIDGKPLEETLTLQAGMIVTMTPRARNHALDHRWRESIGMFNDDPSFPEFVEAVEASREAEKDRS